MTLRSFKRRIQSLLGRDVYSTVQVKCPTLHLGTVYGGWTVCPDLLHRESIIYSFGVGEDISFDLGIIQRFGATVHAFDPTPRSIEWVKRQQLPPQFILHPYGIASYDGEATFHPPE